MALRSLAVALAAALALAAPAAARSADLGACSPDVSLLGFSDALNKTTFQGTSVGGLSALSLTGHGAKALVDNQAPRRRATTTSRSRTACRRSPA
jgi:hypothetical protein